MNKEKLRDELLAQLNEMLVTARTAHQSAVEGAFHSEAKAENDKDTRGLEQSYIARGQAMRVDELEQAVATIAKLELKKFGSDDAVGMSALVTVEDDGETRRYFVAPFGGGNVLAGGINVVTLSSPVGKALFGKQAGDDIELRLGGKAKELSIERVE